MLKKYLIETKALWMSYTVGTRERIPPPIFPKTNKVSGNLNTLFEKALKINPQSI